MTLDEVSKIAQECFQSTPTIVLGSGASMPHGLPSMRDLKDHLLANVVPEGENESDNWLSVKTALSGGDHLETAMEGVPLPKGLTRQIVSETWKCINAKDYEVFKRTVQQVEKFPLGVFLRKSFQSTTKKINIVTTNYDRVIEYACNSAGILYSTGFKPGYMQSWGNLEYREKGEQSRRVEILKVHGSLDWFTRTDGTNIGLPVFELPHADLAPQIVTPGLNKFEAITQDPFRTCLNNADDALKNASAFLSVGFGFRDPQIHPKIIERIKNKNVPIVVLGRTLTSEAKKFLKEKAGNRYLGIERSGVRSRVFTAKVPDGFELDSIDLWSLEGFTKLVS